MNLQGSVNHGIARIVSSIYIYKEQLIVCIKWCSFGILQFLRLINLCSYNFEGAHLNNSKWEKRGKLESNDGINFIISQKKQVLQLYYCTRG